MELPHKFKELYRHWSRHTQTHKPTLGVEDVFTDPKLYDDVARFVRERIAIWEKKYKGLPPPYTTDPVLSRYRFCNMLREFDRQTIEYHELLNPLRDDFPRWLLNMFYARMVARPQTLNEVGLLSFEEDENEMLLQRLMALPRPRYGTPYVFPVSVIMKSTTPTRETFIARHLPSGMRIVTDEIDSWDGMSVAKGVERLIPLFGYNLRFLWTEVLIDVAYQYPERIDLFKEFPTGPGSAPTFARINANEEPSILAKKLGELGFDSGIRYEGAPIILSAENWEGVGCEFRKYTNLSLGKGRKRIFIEKR